MSLCRSQWDFDGHVVFCTHNSFECVSQFLFLSQDRFVACTRFCSRYRAEEKKRVAFRFVQHHVDAFVFRQVQVPWTHIFSLVRRKRIELRARLTNGHPCRQPRRLVSNPCVPFNVFRVNGDVLASSVDCGRLRLCLKPWRSEPCPLSGQKPVVSTVGCAPWQEVTPTATTSTLRQAQVQVQSVLWTATTAEQRGAATLSVELTQQGNGVCHFLV